MSLWKYLVDDCSSDLQVVALVNVYLLCHGYVQYGVASGKGSCSATWLSRIYKYFLRSTYERQGPALPPRLQDGPGSRSWAGNPWKRFSRRYPQSQRSWPVPERGMYLDPQMNGSITGPYAQMPESAIAI